MINDFFSEPPLYRQYVNKLMEIRRDFPFLQVTSIGQSVTGRQIFCASLGNTQKVSVMAGAFHAQEWLTASLLLRYLEHLCFSIRERTYISGCSLNSSLSQQGLMIVPMVNPDGVSIALEGAESAGSFCDFVEHVQQKSEKSWQANVKGIDINHNFDAGFQKLKQLERENGIVSPSPRQYGGAYPHSEPETVALVKLCQRYYVKSAYAFHSQGQEIFYEYGKSTPPRGRYMAELFAHLSGYELVQNNGLCSHGGFKDYFIEKYNRPGFTIEIGKGENPLPITELEPIYEQLLETMVAMTVL